VPNNLCGVHTYFKLALSQQCGCFETQQTPSTPNETNFLAIFFLFNSPHDGDGAWMGLHGMWGHGIQNIALKLAMF